MTTIQFADWSGLPFVGKFVQAIDGIPDKVQSSPIDNGNGNYMNTAQLAELMGVSQSDAATFVEGIRLQMTKGLNLEAAISSHMEMMNTAFANMAKRCDNASYGERMRGFVIDAFYPESA